MQCITNRALPLPSEACSLTSAASCVSIFLATQSGAATNQPDLCDKPLRRAGEVKPSAHTHGGGGGARGLTSGAAEGGVPGQGDQPTQPEQQDRQEGDISEPHLRCPGSMSAPRGGRRGTEGGMEGGWGQVDRETGRQTHTDRESRAEL